MKQCPDCNKNNINPNNLISLCQSCNNKANYNRDYWYAYFMYIINSKLNKKEEHYESVRT